MNLKEPNQLFFILYFSYPQNPGLTLRFISGIIILMNKNKVWAWVLTVLVIVAVGVVLWQNPFRVRGTNTTEYGNKIAENFPADFPGDSGIVEIVKNEKNQSLVGGTEFVLSYYTTRPTEETIAAISGYASLKGMENSLTENGTNEDGSDYRYFLAENADKSEGVSVRATIVPDTGGTLSLVEISIKK
jgi:hypothetical protein